MTYNTSIPLIAILRGIKPNEAQEHIAALIEEGFGLIEIPLNSPDWRISIGQAVQRFGDKAQIGAGTVLTLSEVNELHAMGVKIIVTPNTDPQVISAAVNKGLNVYIGCATATEAFQALAAGAQALKFFPASALGSSYIKAVKAVLPENIPLYAVGGITPENLAEFIKAGCVGAGLGSDLYRPGQTVEVTREQARRFVQAYIQLGKA